MLELLKVKTLLTDYCTYACLLVNQCCNFNDGPFIFKSIFMTVMPININIDVILFVFQGLRFYKVMGT